jgi:tRNA modification GTPase
MLLPVNDTIAAISTPLGEGGIAVIRLSGPDAVAIVDRLFTGKVRLAEAAPQTIHFGRLADKDGIVDSVLVSLFRAPHSYTGEDVVEVSSHGSVYLAKRILSMLVDAGARHAGPGEFTRRAFLNGKMDLAQAEAVADLIRADSSMSHAQALSQQRGMLSSRIRAIRSEILDICALLELDLDFTEENLEIAAPQKVLSRLNQVRNSIIQLIDSYEHGKALREGIRVVLTGPPNVGKSSILNALLREHRAIVTDVSGTTRDTIEESLQINGLICTIADTAGIRETADVVEQEGIIRARQQIEHADLVIVVGDDQTISGEGELERFKFLVASEVGNRRAVVVFNKSDLMRPGQAESARTGIPDRRVLVISARIGDGMAELEEEIYNSNEGATAVAPGRSVAVSNLRHKQKLEETGDYLDRAIAGARGGSTSELWAADLRSSLLALSEITGENVSEEVLNHIFSGFCIGK